MGIARALINEPPLLFLDEPTLDWTQEAARVARTLEKHLSRSRRGHYLVQPSSL